MTFVKGKVVVSERTHAALKDARATTDAATWLGKLVESRERRDQVILYDLSSEPNLSHLVAEEPREALLNIASELGNEANVLHRSVEILKATFNALAEEVKNLTIPDGMGHVSIVLKPETYKLLGQSAKLYLDTLGMGHEELELLLQESSSDRNALIYRRDELSSSPVCDSIESLIQPLQILHDRLKVSHRALMRACQAVHMESLTQSEMAEFGLDHHGMLGDFEGEPFMYLHSVKLVKVLNQEPNNGTESLTQSEMAEFVEVGKLSLRIARADLSNPDRVDFVISGLRAMAGR